MSIQPTREMRNNQKRETCSRETLHHASTTCVVATDDKVSPCGQDRDSGQRRSPQKYNTNRLESTTQSVLIHDTTHCNATTVVGYVTR
ncbi:MAG: hypothetical protein ACR2N1_23445 [Rubripirellula sp.]